ncbi:MAG TPA: phytoene/squalene synthase family protein [Gammaproteobacteria bacterium]|nr:phytoene/squalene synthase family protein [Gammaproteobacteria bacterium]
MNKVADVADSDLDPEDYQDSILLGVSRTFALTIPQLPEPLRRVVTNAYLLCRIADTIEDESALTSEQKKHFHALLVQVVAGEGDADAFARELTPLLTQDALDAEKDLVGNTAAVIRVTRTFNDNQRNALARCLTIMCEGMPRYERHASVDGLSDLRSLDQYCYYVAGVVGETLTELFCDYSPAIAAHRDAMASLGVSFGQGLQMTNILKDFWEDRDRGVCWLPRDVFKRAGVELGEVCRDCYQPGFGNAYASLISVAHSHLRNAFEYTLLIPEEEVGIRRFCLIALGLAVRTLQSIYDCPDFKSGNDVKISRRAVKNTVIFTRVFPTYDRVLRRWFARLARDLPLQPIAADWSPAELHGEPYAAPLAPPRAAHSAHQ